MKIKPCRNIRKAYWTAKALGYDCPDKAVVQLYVVQKWPLTLIGKTFTKDPRSIRDRLKHLGIPIKKRGLNKNRKYFSWNYVEDATECAKKLGYINPDHCIVSLYNKGWSCRKIGVAFERTPNCINRRLKKIGVQMRSKGGPNNVKSKRSA